MIMRASAMAVAAPPMSFFMSSMAASGLRLRPPVSKQTPLPTRVTLGARSSPQTMSKRRGSSAAARPTAWIIGKPDARSSPVVTSTAAPYRSASVRAAASRASGDRSLAGRLMRSRPSVMASTMRSSLEPSTPEGVRNLAVPPVADGVAVDAAGLRKRSKRYEPSRKPSAARAASSKPSARR